MAALSVMGDVRVVLAEPGLVIDYRGNPGGAAAIRVQSLRKAVQRADEAADQLAANDVAGFVAVNVDLLLKTTSADWRLRPLLERFGDRALADIKTADLGQATSDGPRGRAAGVIGATCQ